MIIFTIFAITIVNRNNYYVFKKINRWVSYTMGTEKRP